MPCPVLVLPAMPCHLCWMQDTLSQAAPITHPCPCSRGFGGWGMTRGPATWLQSVESRYREAQQEEERELDLQESRGATP